MKHTLLITCPKCGFRINGRLWRCPGCGGPDDHKPEKLKKSQLTLSEQIRNILIGK